MTHHTSDSWPIYGVTCSISIKHITTSSPGTGPYNWGGKYELIIFWGYLRGGEEGDHLAVREKITGAPCTHIKRTSSSSDAHVRTHSDRVWYSRTTLYIYIYICVYESANSLLTATSFQSCADGFHVLCISGENYLFHGRGRATQHSGIPQIRLLLRKATKEKETINHSARWGHTFLVWVTPVGNTILLRIVRVCQHFCHRAKHRYSKLTLSLWVGYKKNTSNSFLNTRSFKQYGWSHSILFLLSTKLQKD